MKIPHVELKGRDWFSHFSFPSILLASSVIFAVLPYISNPSKDPTIPALIMFIGSIIGFLWQRRALRYVLITTNQSCETNYQIVVSLADKLGWSITNRTPARSLQATVPPSDNNASNHLVSVLFDNNAVYANSIFYPRARFDNNLGGNTINIGFIAKAVTGPNP